MSITNYSELQTAVTNWMMRSDLSGEAPDFIKLAESEIRRKFQGVSFKASSTLTGTQSSRNLTLPTDYEKPIALYLTTYGDEDELTHFDNLPYSAYDGVPEGWTISSDGSETKLIELDKPCNEAHTFRFLYQQKLDIATSSTNWLLTNHPDVYLTGALHWASKYTFRGDTSKLSWGPDFYRAIEEVDISEAEHDAGRAFTDPMLVTRHGFNINSGN